MCTVGDCVKKGLRLDTGATTNLYSKQLGLEKTYRRRSTQSFSY